MKILFNKTFFKFVLGFTGLVALGVVGIVLVAMQVQDTGVTAEQSQTSVAVDSVN